MSEDLRLTVLPAQGDTREMDVDLTWEALDAPVTLRGSEEAGKSYGGFSARFAPREGTVLRADGATLAKDEDLNPHQWAELEGVYGGKQGRTADHARPKDLTRPTSGACAITDSSALLSPAARRKSTGTLWSAVSRSI